MQEHEQIGIEIDKAADLGDKNELGDLVCEIDALLDKQSSNNAILFYFRANALSAIRKSDPSFQESQFDWKQPELTKEIISLREAIRCSAFKDLNIVQRCQIWTNLGNAFDAVGRPIDALAAWSEALLLLPNFAMAQAGRGWGRFCPAIAPVGLPFIVLGSMIRVTNAFFYQRQIKASNELFRQKLPGTAIIRKAFESIYDQGTEKSKPTLRKTAVW